MNPYSFSLSFRVRHSSLKCEEIASVIGLEPKFIQNVGEDRKTPKGKNLSGKYIETYCSFELEPKTHGILEDALRKWCEYLSAHIDFLKGIRASGGKAEFFAGVFLSGNSGIELEPADLASAASIGVSLSLDLYGEGS